MLPAINNWFARHSNGAWEHEPRVFIHNDNNAWHIKIACVDAHIKSGDRDLFGCGINSDALNNENEHIPWLHIFIKDNHLYASCSPERLDRMNDLLATFLK